MASESEWICIKTFVLLSLTPYARIPFKSWSPLPNDSPTISLRTLSKTMGFLIRKPEGTPGSAWPAIAIGLFVAFGGVLFGYARSLLLWHNSWNDTCSNQIIYCRYCTGTINGILAMPHWQDTFSTGYRDSTGHLNVSSSQSASIVSILSAGTFFGALGVAQLPTALAVVGA